MPYCWSAVLILRTPECPNQFCESADYTVRGGDESSTTARQRASLRASEVRPRRRIGCQADEPNVASLAAQRGTGTSLRQLLEEQQVKSSANYHHWLSPEEFGNRFGPTDADIQLVTDWLTSEGFQRPITILLMDWLAVYRRLSQTRGRSQSGH
jgi:hypothetical protein